MTHAVLKYHAVWREQAKLVSVPKVRLYVDQPGAENWFVHVGHVTDRGRWRTEPHAHPAYSQIIFVRNGHGVMNLEGCSVPFEGPCALIIPVGCVHGLDYELDADRWVVTIEQSYLTQVNAKLDAFIAFWSMPRIITLSPVSDMGMAFHNLIGRLQYELDADAVGRVVGIEAVLTTLMLMLLRGTDLGQIGNEGAMRNDVRLVDRFRKLIEQHYRENLPLKDYASMMAVSLAQLRTACASAAEQSPTKIIHARLITEAKRTLIFGDLSVEQIAFQLGFGDAAYFTRFFRREVGRAPSEFRVAARQHPHSSAQGGNLIQDER